MQLMLQQQEGKKGRCELCREMLNSGSAAMIVMSMVVLAVMLIVYYFKSEMTVSTGP
jgi:hypothetical protein